MAKKISTKEYENWSKDELIKEILKIKSTTYGLVWHRDLPEEKIDLLINPDARTPSELFSNEVAGKPFPILKEIKGKEIQTDNKKPVNLLIEGDNYHSLAVLNFTHQEAVDLIYIDPPYNTGNNDFIYNDKFVDIEDPFRHSKWLSFMEKRLKLAKNLLKKSGVIFISIDDHEQAPLKMLCDEIFGENNFIAQIVWQKKYAASNDNKTISNIHEYILCYTKSENMWRPNLFDRPDELNAKYKNPDNDPRGDWYSTNLSVKTFSEKNYYEIISPTGKKFLPPPTRCWVVSKEKYNELLKDNRIWFGKDGNSRPYQKTFLSEVQQGIVPDTLWLHKDAGHNIEAKSILRAIFEGQQNLFDTPKPVRLIKRLLKMSTKKDAVVLDFFAGSGTTGHAALELNLEDGGNRRFILCTNNGDEKSEHKIASDICYPRIQKVMKEHKNITGEKVEGLGGNLKYYTCDFVEAEPTDRNKRKLVRESTEMLCIREDAYELVQESGEFRIFRNHNKYVGIIFYEEAIDDYKKAIKKIDGHFNTYVFSLGDDAHEKQFVDMKNKVTLCAIPEVILKVYREIFK